MLWRRLCKHAIVLNMPAGRDYSAATPAMNSGGEPDRQLMAGVNHDWANLDQQRRHRRVLTRMISWPVSLLGGERLWRGVLKQADLVKSRSIHALTNMNDAMLPAMATAGLRRQRHQYRSTGQAINWAT